MTAPITSLHRLTLQPLLFAAVQRGLFDARSTYVPLEGSGQAGSLTLFAEYGVAERVAVGAQAALVHNRRTLGGAAAASTGPGDVVLFARYAAEPLAVPWLPDLSLFAQVKLPLGRADGLEPSSLGTDARGTGTWDGTVGLDLTRYAWPVVLHLDLFLTGSLEARLDGVPTRPGPAFLWAASAELPFPLPLWPRRFALMAELSGRFAADTRASGEPVPDSGARELTLGLGVELLFTDELQLLVGYQRTLWGANVPAVDVLGLTLVPTL
jgi:hypothetical protein